MSKKNEEKKKKVLIPGSLRQRLMAAISMLLVATVLLVGSTYAWFTLSTAPEVTGITTSVGANGNLEIALLPVSGDTSAITSAVGDSYAKTGDYKVTNLTWGNLVDLSAAAYHLGDIKLLPARINGSTEIYGKDAAPTQIDTGTPLATAQYGADGRVSELKADTTTAIADGTGIFTTKASTEYGVRAVGVSSTLTDRQIAFRKAQTAFTAARNGIEKSTQSAIANNQLVFMSTMSKLTDDSVTIEDAEEVAAIKAVVAGVKTSLEKIKTAYEEAVNIAAIGLAPDDSFDAATVRATAVGTLTASDPAHQYKTDYEAISGAIADMDELSSKTSFEKADLKKIVADATFKGENDATVNVTGVADISKVKTAELSGGALGFIADNAGEFNAVNFAGITGKVAFTSGVEAAKLTAVSNAVNAATEPSSSEGGPAKITDTYGFILDFAFRTNASDSKLQLQTDAAQRVYTDSESATTQGKGSNVTYTYANIDDTKAREILGALRFVFFDPADGTVYATAKLGNITALTGSATADIVLDKPEGTAVDALDDIVELEQNTAKKVSVLGYLDGDYVNNGNVANAATTGTDLAINFQFSSSANLIPMENTALRNLA